MRAVKRNAGKRPDLRAHAPTWMHPGRRKAVNKSQGSASLRATRFQGIGTGRYVKWRPRRGVEKQARANGTASTEQTECQTPIKTRWSCHQDNNAPARGEARPRAI